MTLSHDDSTVNIIVVRWYYYYYYYYYYRYCLTVDDVSKQQPSGVLQTVLRYFTATSKINRSGTL